MDLPVLDQRRRRQQQQLGPGSLQHPSYNITTKSYTEHICHAEMIPEATSARASVEKMRSSGRHAPSTYAYMSIAQRSSSRNISTADLTVD